MTTSKDQIRTELQTLVNKGVKIFTVEVDKQNKTKQNKTRQKKSQHSEEDVVPIELSYQDWYTQALPVVRQLLPERYSEFQEQYKNEKRKDITFLTYTISDYLIGVHIKRNGQDILNPLSAFTA